MITSEQDEGRAYWVVQAKERISYEGPYGVITTPAFWRFHLYSSLGLWELKIMDTYTRYVWYDGKKPSEKEIAKQADKLIEGEINLAKVMKESYDRDRRSRLESFDVGAIIRNMKHG